MWCSRLAAALLVASSLFAGYSARGTVAFTGASTSTQTSITLVAIASDTRFKTVANGGLVTHLCSRNGTNDSPCDVIVTDDPGCGAGSTAFKWGWDGDYTAFNAGTLALAHMWILIPSYTTSGITPYVCVGNTLVSTYQGGAVGAEFDGNTKLALHLPDGSTLSAVDFSATGNHGTVSGPAATAGMIDGGASFNGSTDKITGFSQFTASGATAFTYECWVNPSRLGNNAQGNAFFYQGSGSSQEGLALMIYQDTTHTSTLRWSRNGSGYLIANNNVITLSTWQHVAFVYSSGTGTFYVNGVNAGSGTATTSIPTAGGAIGYWYLSSDATRYFQGALDECRYAATDRGSSWIVTEYANQNSPPAVSSFVTLGGAPTRILLGVGQ